MNEFVLAGDLGGTNLRIAAVDRSGRILCRFEASTPRYVDESKIVESAVGLARSIRRKMGSDALAFGFAIPAIMNSAEGKIFTSPNLPELNGADLGRRLSEELGLGVLLENDANAAAVGENWLGAAKGSSSSICITLGTGVGGGIILNGKVLQGPDGTAGEIGHVCVVPAGPPCGCGSNGCLEQFASATAIVRMASELIADFPDSRISSMDEFDASMIFGLGLEGDALCLEVFRRAGEYLGIAAAGLINLLNPEIIAIGGGAANGWELFIGPMRTEIVKRAFQQPAERARIVRASLGADAGIVGAAFLAFEKIGLARASRIR